MDNECWSGSLWHHPHVISLHWTDLTRENDVPSAEGWVSPAAGCRVLAALCARQDLVSAGHPEDKIVKAGTREQSQGTARLEILQLLNLAAGINSPEDKIVKAGTREQSQSTARLEILQ